MQEANESLDIEAQKEEGTLMKHVCPDCGSKDVKEESGDYFCKKCGLEVE